MRDARTGSGAANAGVLTARAVFERALVADVLRVLPTVGVHEVQAGNFLQLAPIEDTRGRALRIRFDGQEGG